ncbi:hypothetical protein COCNU_12G000040 [Cocos nucifera]|uniref:Uncharacterized protein n=1 Tax=Cocos nucifera TaxID=13894 RepID=A0A8K0IQD3_COCNU|nr:hypothetical protein COCNU_12G000040 [Cocos nucifera]
MKVERVRAKVSRLKVASKIQAIEVEHLRKVSWREEEASTRLRAALAFSEVKKKKTEEEISVERERAVKAFKSSQAMEDIKIAFFQETFLEGFEICMRRVVKNFSGVDLDFLTDEPRLLKE